MPVVIPFNTAAKAGTGLGAGGQGVSAVSAFHNLTKPTNWWQRGMTSMLPGWMPTTGGLTPPWAPKPITSPLHWAQAYGRGIGGNQPLAPSPLAPAIGPRAIQNLVGASNDLWRPSLRRGF